MNELVDALAATPGRLRVLLAESADQLARPHPGGMDWVPADVLLHVRSSDAILAPRIPQILARPNLPLADLDERTYAGVLARAEPSVAEQIDVFAARRAELVALLRALRPVDWSLTGQHELRGPVSVRELASWIAEHEAEHLTQIEQGLKENN